MEQYGDGFTINALTVVQNDGIDLAAVDELVMVMIADGATRCSGLESCILSVNDYYILLPGESVSLQNKSNTDCVIWILKIKKELLDALQAPGENLWDAFLLVPRRYMSAMLRSNMIIREMFQNVFVNQIPMLNKTYARMHVGFIAVVCIRSCLVQQGPKRSVVHPPLTMTDIYQYVRQNISGDLSLKAIASALHFDPSYLAHTFRKKAGMSLHQYVLSRRLNYANVLLRQGLSVQQTAERSGFGSTISFIRIYKQRFKITPGEASKQYMEKHTGPET